MAKTPRGFTVMDYDRKAIDRLINKPAVCEVARLIIEQVHNGRRAKLYAAQNYDLKFVWSTKNIFSAEAMMAPNGDHIISMSYQAAIDIYQDAFVFTLLCDRTFIDPIFDPVFQLLGYGNARSDVIPHGMTPEDAKIEIIRLMTKWVYLHELGHLLQRHNSIASNLGLSNAMGGSDRVVDEISDMLGLDGRAASLRHAFELSADYEALSWILITEAAKPGGISVATLWCLSAGLMCMFCRFYGESSRTLDDIPTGTHPHPALRMRMAINKVLHVLEKQPEIRDSSPEIADLAKTKAIMDHALYATDMYYHIRYLGLEARGPLLDTIHPRNALTPESYRMPIQNIWQEVRSEVVAGHLGYGEPMVLPSFAIVRL